MTRVRPEVRCPLCGQLAHAAWLRNGEGEVELGCASCGAAVRYPTFEREQEPAAAQEPARPPTQPPAQERARATAPETGPSTEALLAAMEVVEQLPDELATRYRRVVEQGDQRSDHHALVQYAATTQQLKPLGLIYRSRLEAFPEDAIAAEMRERLVGVAIAALGPPATHDEASRQVKKWTTAGAVVFFLFSMAIATSFMLRTGCFDLTP